MALHHTVVTRAKLRCKKFSIWQKNQHSTSLPLSLIVKNRRNKEMLKDHPTTLLAAKVTGHKCSVSLNRAVLSSVF